MRRRPSGYNLEVQQDKGRSRSDRGAFVATKGRSSRCKVRRRSDRRRSANVECEERVNFQFREVFSRDYLRRTMVGTDITLARSSPTCSALGEKRLVQRYHISRCVAHRSIRGKRRMCLRCTQPHTVIRLLTNAFPRPRQASNICGCRAGITVQSVISSTTTRLILMHLLCAGCLLRS